MPEAREVIAVIVVIGSFGLLGGFIFTGGHLDTGTGVALVAFCTGSLMSVLGFYFGRTNGAATSLALSANQLSQQALNAATQRRVSDPPVVAAPVTVVAAPPAP